MYFCFISIFELGSVSNVNSLVTKALVLDDSWGLGVSTHQKKRIRLKLHCGYRQKGSFSKAKFLQIKCSKGDIKWFIFMQECQAKTKKN